MSLRQAAQQALEALESDPDAMVEVSECHWDYKRNLAITALQAALAEPDQEMTKQKPVAWTDGRGFIASHADSFPRGTAVSPLYALPPTPRKPDLEALNAELVEALREIEWSNDTTWQRDRARAALAKWEASK